MSGFDIGSGILGFATSFMDNLWNSYNVGETNAANREIANQTNQYNAQIARDNREYDRLVRAQDWMHYLETDQEAYRRFLENRQYESVGAQMQRLREQGINPYLAMYGNGGHLGSSGGSVPSIGSPPHGHNGNNQPFAQTGAPMQAYTGGLGISQGLANFLSLQASEREDSRLESDMAYIQNKMELEFMEYLSSHQFRGAQAKFWKDQIDQMRQDYLIRKDEFKLQSDWQNFQKSAIQYDQQCRQVELRIQEMATQSNIALNAASAANLRQLVQESLQRIDSMKNSDSLSQNEFWHRVQEDIFSRKIALMRLGIDEDMLPSQKLRNYIGGVVDAVGTGIGIYLGLKHGGKNYVHPSYPPNSSSTGMTGYPNVKIPKYGMQY